MVTIGGTPQFGLKRAAKAHLGLSGIDTVVDEGVRDVKSGLFVLSSLRFLYGLSCLLICSQSAFMATDCLYY